MISAEYLNCPVCSGKNFLIKYEAAYIYSYFIDSDAPGLKNKVDFLPFMYDDREQKESKQYLECEDCGTKFPCFFNQWNNGIEAEVLFNAVTMENAVRKV